MIHRTYSASSASDAPLPSDMKKPYFAGRCYKTGVVLVLDMKFLRHVELTIAQMAEMSMAVSISGLNAADNAFFVGFPNSVITLPHVSLTWNSKYYQGTMGDSSDDAVSGLVNQLQSLKSNDEASCQDRM